MIKKIWRWVKGSENVEMAEDDDTVGGNNPEKFSSAVKDENLEYLFHQLLEGVANGWGENRIEQFFQKLEPRITVEVWLGWLQKYRTKLLKSFAPNYHLASRMIILGELTASLPFVRPIGDLAYKLGEDILKRTDGNLEIESRQDTEIGADNSVESLADILTLLQKDENFARETAEKLGLDTTDAGIIMEKLIEMSQSVSEFELGDINVPATIAKDDDHVDQSWLEHWFNLGLEKAQNGDLEGAISSWEHILKVDETIAQAWHNRGSALGYLERYEEAIDSFDRALSIDVNDVESWHDRGNALYNLHRYDEALMSWERVIGIQPNYTQAWYSKGLVLEHLNRFEEALEMYLQVRALDPNFPDLDDKINRLNLRR
ncbi:MAG: tetratricopeptide repeat protein [Cyanobacterium sp. T60_A2020_053]|nr:tetratricopeptide repeat protein [Cyanobacterium sp. T60_A2020_053]